MPRRLFLPMAAGLACSCGPLRRPGAESTVAVLHAGSYAADLANLLARGAQLCGLEARGKRVLLKPNLVEFDSANSINTDASVLAAAVELFERLGAAEVMIGEGPGHRRDTMDLAEQARYRSLVPRFEQRFVDLNLDEAAAVSGFFGGDVYLSKKALAADLVVSIPKMKTHHWVGATLSMKNFFGVVPGAVYGWPKNWLHYVGINRAIPALQRIFRRTFAIVDGIVGMEGNGPIQGAPKHAGAIVMGADLVAVDATCCRIMGIDPARVDYIRAVDDLGNIDADAISQRGESPAALRTDFELIAQFRHLRLA
ncbi:MAG: DUF362 domain-containing protein [Bryobacteraceae bacterium]|nr:DUF362 domain-containing protein [Bryobacteraceae bacterium]